VKSNHAVGTVSGNFEVIYSTQRSRKKSTSSNCKVQ